MKLLPAFFALLFISGSAFSQVKIGNNPNVINPSSLFEMESQTKAVLFPRMNTAQMNAISLPVTGMLIYNTDSLCLFVRNATQWQGLCNLSDKQFANLLLLPSVRDSLAKAVGVVINGYNFFNIGNGAITDSIVTTLNGSLRKISASLLFSNITLPSGQVFVGNSSNIATPTGAGAAGQILTTNPGGTGATWSSNLSLPGNLTVSGPTTLSGGLAVTGATSLSNLTVTGSTVFPLTQGKVFVGNASNQTSIVGAITTGQVLTTDAGTNATWSSNLNLPGTLNVTGATTLNSLSVTGGATLSALTVIGATSLPLTLQSGTIFVGNGSNIATSTGAGAAGQILTTNPGGTGATWSSNLALPGTLSVTGATTLGSLSVTGGATVTNLTVTGSTVLPLTLGKVFVGNASNQTSIVGASTTGQVLTTDGGTNATWSSNLNLPGTLNVTGATTLNSLSVTGGATVSALTVIGATNLPLTLPLGNIYVGNSSNLATATSAGATGQILTTNPGGTGATWSSNLNLPGNITIGGSTTLGGGLSVTGGTTYLSGPLSVTGNTTLNSLSVTGGATVTNLTVTGSTTLSLTQGKVFVGNASNQTSIVGASTTGQVLTTDGGTNATWGSSLNLPGNINVAGTTTLGGGLSVTGTTDLVGALSVTGASTLNSLSVTGGATVTNLTVTGSTALPLTLGKVFVGNALNQTSIVGASTTGQVLTTDGGTNATWSSNLSLPGNIIVAGATTLAGGLSVTGGNTYVSGPFSVTGTTTLAGLTVTGGLALPLTYGQVYVGNASNQASATGATTIGQILTTNTGNTRAIFSNDLNLPGNLNVTGGTTLNYLSVTGNATVGGNLTSTGFGTFNTINTTANVNLNGLNLGTTTYTINAIATSQSGGTTTLNGGFISTSSSPALVLYQSFPAGTVSGVNAYGETGIIIQNITGANGATFYNKTLSVVDVGFQASSGKTSNLRFEQRSNSQVFTSNTNGEFELIQTTPSGGSFGSGVVLPAFAVFGTNNSFITSNLQLGGTIPANGISTQNYQLSVNGTANISTLNSNGPVYSNSGSLTNTNPSDRRLKNTIAPLNYGLAEVLKLKPSTFYFNNDKAHKDKKFGFIAQEVQQVMPELVRPLDDGSGHLGIQSDAINVAMVKAIQEQQKMITDLQKQVDELKKQIKKGK